MGCRRGRVGFVKKQVRGHGVFYAGNAVYALRNAYALGCKLTGKFGFASETVNNPQLLRLEGLVQLHQAPVASDTMYYERFLHPFGKGGVMQENCFLICLLTTAQGVEARFAYGNYARVEGKAVEQVEGLLLYRLDGAPRVYAHAIPSLAADAAQRHLVGFDRADDGRPGAPVGVNIVER